MQSLLFVRSNLSAKSCHLVIDSDFVLKLDKNRESDNPQQNNYYKNSKNEINQGVKRCKKQLFIGQTGNVYV